RLPARRHVSSVKGARRSGDRSSKTDCFVRTNLVSLLSLNSIGEDLVKALVAAGYAVIVKLHDRSRDPRYEHSGGVDWGARLEPILRGGGGWLADTSDACPYLAAADLMITDHSSLGFEYLLLDRPLIRID